jgi:hypothetical protein
LDYDEFAMKKPEFFFKWQTKEGQKDVQDDPRSGEPKMQRRDVIVDNLGALRSKIGHYFEVPTRLQESVLRKRPEF